MIKFPTAFCFRLPKCLRNKFSNCDNFHHLFVFESLMNKFETLIESLAALDCRSHFMCLLKKRDVLLHGTMNEYFVDVTCERRVKRSSRFWWNSITRRDEKLSDLKSFSLLTRRILKKKTFCIYLHVAHRTYLYLVEIVVRRWESLLYL